MHLVGTIVVACLSAVLTVALAVLAASRLSAHGAETRKRRDRELTLANAFYGSFGEVCAVWRQWNYRHKSHSARPDFEAFRLVMLERVCRAEGQLEAVFLKMCSERLLEPSEVASLRSFRQACQSLRERIQDNKALSYGTPDDPDYLEFKRLATAIGTTLAKSAEMQPGARRAFEAFKEVTGNDQDGRWSRVGRRPA